MSTFTATAQAQAAPPYVSLRYDTQDTNKTIVSVDMKRDGVPVRIASSTSPSSAVTWKDYDAPFGVQVTYVATVGVAQAPTGTVSEDWTGTLSSKGWTSITNVSQDSSVMRTNLCPNPSFEVDTSNWSADNGPNATVTLSRTTAEHYLGTAALALTPSPVTQRNYITNPSFETGTTGWAVGSGTAGIARSGAGAGFVRTYSLQVTMNVLGPLVDGVSFVNGPVATGIVPGRTYYFGAAYFFDPDGTGDGKPCIAYSRMLIRWFNSSGGQVGGDSYVIGDSQAPKNAWHTRWGSAVAPAGADRVAIYPAINLDNGFSQGGRQDTWYLDAVYVSDVNFYFDGSSVGDSTYRYRWLGTVGNSVSVREQTVLKAGARIKIPVTAGKALTTSFYTKMKSGSTAVRCYYWWSTGTVTAPVNVGTATTSWQRFSLSLTAPVGATSAEIYIEYDSLGWDIDAFIDAVLMEASDVLRPYFDGSNNELPASTELGAWSAAWTDTSGLSTSTASYNHTIKPSGSPSSLVRTFNFASSAVKLFGFALPNAGTPGATVTLTMSDNSTVVVAISRDAATTTYDLTAGTSTATLTRSGDFTGEVDLNFLNGRVFLVHVDSGASISVPLSAPAVIKSVTFSLGNGAVAMPFTLVPGVVTTTESLSTTVTMTPDDAWLIHPYNPTKSLRIDAGQGCEDVFATVDSARQVTRSSPTSLLQPIGSRRMIAISLGPRKDPVWDLELLTKTGASYDAVEALFSDASPLRFDYSDALWYDTYYRWTGTPGGSTSEKLQDGTVVWTNLLQYPTADSTSGVSAPGVNGVLSKPTVTDSISGSTKAYRLTRISDTAGNCYLIVTGIVLQPGTYVFSTYFRKAPGSTSRMSPQVVVSGSTTLAVSLNYAAPDTWDRIVLPFTVPTVQQVDFILRDDGASTVANGMATDFDALMLEAANSAGSFFYGGSAGVKGCQRDMRIPKGWYSPGDLTEERDVDDWRSPIRRWGVTLSPVSAPTTIPQG